MRYFDLHCDTLGECCIGHTSLLENTLQLDLKRARGCFEAYAQVFAVWTPDTIRGEAAFMRCKTMFDTMKTVAAEAENRLHIVRGAADLQQAVQNGQTAAILAAESGASCAGSLDRLEELIAADMRVMTLTWNGDNELGSGCLGSGGGLTAFGKEAVRPLTPRRVMIDVSHLNERGFADVAAQTDAPFIASHSVCAAVHPHARNLQDWQIDEIVRRGGLIGLNLCESQIGGTDFACVERHLEHLLSRGAEGCAAFGCDFDGTVLPPSFGDICVIPRLQAWLTRKNRHTMLSDRLFFGNSYDFFRRML